MAAALAVLAQCRWGVVVLVGFLAQVVSQIRTMHEPASQYTHAVSLLPHTQRDIKIIYIFVAAAVIFVAAAVILACCIISCFMLCMYSEPLHLHMPIMSGIMTSN